MKIMASAYNKWYQQFFTFSLLYIVFLTIVLSYTDIILVLPEKVKVGKGVGGVGEGWNWPSPPTRLKKNLKKPSLSLNHNLMFKSQIMFKV